MTGRLVTARLEPFRFPSYHEDKQHGRVLGGISLLTFPCYSKQVRISILSISSISCILFPRFFISHLSLISISTLLRPLYPLPCARTYLVSFHRKKKTVPLARALTCTLQVVLFTLFLPPCQRLTTLRYANTSLKRIEFVPSSGQIPSGTKPSVRYR